MNKCFHSRYEYQHRKHIYEYADEDKDKLDAENTDIDEINIQIKNIIKKNPKILFRKVANITPLELINKLDDISLCKLRNIKLGFVYQFHHLLPEFSALENILMPLLISNHKITKELKERALFILNKLNLYNKEERYPSQLSGGERQRVAIARAIIHAPQLIFADEPTGNLDNRTSHQVLDTLLELQQEFNTSIIIVTHDLSIADKTHTKYQLKHGHLN